MALSFFFIQRRALNRLKEGPGRVRGGGGGCVLRFSSNKPDNFWRLNFLFGKLT